MEEATLTLLPENTSFKQKKTALLNQPIVLGRLLDGQDPNAVQAGWIRFNSKVVSRSHAKLSFISGKFFVQDTKSSSGTFVNGERLSPQGTESMPRELHDCDIIKLGEDYNQDGILHQCVMFKVKLPGNKIDPEDEKFLKDLSDANIDRAGQENIEASIEEEFHSVWSSLVVDINLPLKKLRNNANSVTETSSLSSPTTRSITQTTSSFSSISPFSSRLSQNDTTTTVTLIQSKIQPAGQSFHLNPLAESTEPPSSTSGDVPKIEVTRTQTEKTSSSKTDNTAAFNDCKTFVESLPWESDELKNVIMEMANKQDQQLLAFYKSLKGFPTSFINVASKYAKHPQSN